MVLALVAQQALHVRTGLQRQLLNQAITLQMESANPIFVLLDTAALTLMHFKNATMGNILMMVT